MNTSNLKKVAPKARTAFIHAITTRAAELGITAAGCEVPVISNRPADASGIVH